MKTEYTEMSVGNMYTNMADFVAQKIEETPKHQGAKTNGNRALQILVILQIIMFCILAVFTSVLFVHYKSTREETFQLQNNDTEIMKQELNQLEKTVSNFPAQLQNSIQETISKFTAQLETSKRESKPSCESGWVEFAGHCYFFSTIGLNWRNAVDMCLSRQSHLAVITSAEEQTFLANQSNGTSYWIGLTDEGTENRFRWIDGTTYSYTSWKPGEPTNLRNQEHCVHLWHKGNWNDNVCSIDLSAICEKRMT
ncbi:C-type lectin domain family 4 member G-like isoform X2 [Hyperolius riggenbachi]|uniref:C-type lectin domain family 4 member G-like isoform X2 n=1 Tax=Hyperolius riggenbachi TaxID=752182 RepID=UPI0035A37FD8